MKMGNKQREEFIKRVQGKEERKKNEKNKKMVKTAGMLGLATAIGVSSGAISNKHSELILPEKKPVVQKENYVKIIPNMENIETIVDNLKTQEDVIRYLKNEYIEEYEKKMGNTDLTTQDIEILESYQNVIYRDNNTGEYITHAGNIYDTKDMMEKQGISYEEKTCVKVYEVHHGDEIIDAMVLESRPQENGENKKIPVKVIIGGSSYKPYDSTLVEMGTVISEGIKYWDNIEKDEVSKEMTKKPFIEALKEWKQKEKTKLALQKEEGYEIGD